MAARNALVQLVITAKDNASQALDGFFRRTQQGAEETGNKISRIGVGIKSLIAGAVAALSGFVVGNFFKDATDSANQLQQELGELRGVIEATGGAAGVSAEQIDQFARDLDEATLGSASAVRQAATILLTFKSIAGDTFFETLTLAQDMAQVFKSDLSSATTQLAKALEDPIKGISALSRVGVTFTDGEKEKIKALVQSNKLLEAQGIILATLRGQVGGAAAAAGSGLAGAIDLVGKRFTDLKEKIGAAIIPAATGFFNSIATNLSAVNARVTELVSSGKLAALTQSMAGVFEAGAAAVKDFFLSIDLTSATEKINTFAGNVRSTIQNIGNSASALSSLLSAVFNGFLVTVNGAIAGVAKSMELLQKQRLQGVTAEIEHLRSEIGLVGESYREELQKELDKLLQKQADLKASVNDWGIAAVDAAGRSVEALNKADEAVSNFNGSFSDLNDTQRKANKNLETELLRITQQNDALKQTIGALEQQIGALETQVSTAETSLKKMEAAGLGNSQQADRLRGVIKDLNAELANNRQTLEGAVSQQQALQQAQEKAAVAAAQAAAANKEAAAANKESTETEKNRIAIINGVAVALDGYTIAEGAAASATGLRQKELELLGLTETDEIKRIEQLASILEKDRLAREQSRKAAQAQAGAQREAAASAEEGAEATERSAQAAGSLNDIISFVITSLKTMGDTAFNNFLNVKNSTLGASTALVDLNQRLLSVTQTIQHNLIFKLNDGFNRFVNRFHTVTVEFLESAIEVQRWQDQLTDALESGRIGSLDLRQAAAAADSALQNLDGKQVQPLRDAIQEIRDQLQALDEEVNESVRRTQVELARLRGDQAGADLLELEADITERLIENQERLTQARRAGQQDLVNLLREERAAIEEIQKLRERDIEQQDRERRQRTPDNVTPIRPSGGGGGGGITTGGGGGITTGGGGGITTGGGGGITTGGGGGITTGGGSTVLNAQELGEAVAAALRANPPAISIDGQQVTANVLNNLATARLTVQ